MNSLPYERLRARAAVSGRSLACLLLEDDNAPTTSEWIAKWTANLPQIAESEVKDIVSSYHARKTKTHCTLVTNLPAPPQHITHNSSLRMALSFGRKAGIDTIMIAPPTSHAFSENLPKWVKIDIVVDFRKDATPHLHTPLVSVHQHDRNKTVLTYCGIDFDNDPNSTS